MIRTDIWGPSPTLSTYGYKYYIHFIDNHSRYTWVYLLKAKSEALNSFRHFKTQVELQLGLKIKAIQTDGGGEHRAFAPFLRYLCGTADHGLHFTSHSTPSRGLHLSGFSDADWGTDIHFRLCAIPW